MSESTTISKRKLLYGINDKMPLPALILTSLQHMLICTSIGLALPVAVSTAAGLDVAHSGSYLAAALFGMGLVSILQSISGKYLGSGQLSMSTTDSAAIGCCVLAAETGGIPLVLGLSIFSALCKFIMGHFAYRVRKLFSTEAAGTMMLLLGINLVPTSFKYFLGTAEGFNIRAFTVSCLTLLAILICVLFVKPLKPYTALVGIIIGYVLAIAMGVFDMSIFDDLKNSSVIGLPVYMDLKFAFSWEMVPPFFIIALASFVDNIGDFTATQANADPNMTKPDWKGIERGIRSSGLGNAISAALGGSLQSTATANIGISRASGIVTRKVAILGACMLMAVSFFPGLTGLLSMIPKCVLGAVIMYSMCYIMSSGLSTLQGLELDDRKILSIFLSVSAGISTLIPGLYSFLPENVQAALISPMVLGVCVLIVTTLLGKIGTNKHYVFTTGVDNGDVKALEEQLECVCKEWGTTHKLLRKLQIALDSICESLYDIDSEARIEFAIKYDPLQIRVYMKAQSDKIQSISGRDDINNKGIEHIPDSDGYNMKILELTVKMLNNMFDNVKISRQSGCIHINMDEDLDC